MICLRSVMQGTTRTSQSSAQQDGGIEPTNEVAQWTAWISSRADQLDPPVEAEPSMLDLSFEEYERGLGGLETTDAARSKPSSR